MSLSPPFTDPAFYRALALSERLPAPDSPGDPDLGDRRLERWRQEPPFAEEPALFGERLAADGLDEAAFRRLLGEPEAALAARLPVPSWLSRLAEVFAEYAQGEGADLPLPPFEAVANRTGIGFLGLVLPLLRAGYDRLFRGLSALAGNVLDPAVVAPQLFHDLLRRLFALLPRTLVLELQAARLEGTLAGETAEGRFASFAERLRDPAQALAILARYPVLARLALSTVEDWGAASLETCGRLAADAAALAEAFGDGLPLGPLTAVRPGAGDLHRGGRSVTLLRFDSGLRLVYKPRSLAAEAAFQGLLGWANDRGFTPALPRLRVLDRGTHGWVEFIAASPCREEAEVRRFYARQGGYLALFYLLDASDQHYENIIAAGENPYPVDLETLFHPRVDGPRVEEPEEIPGSALFHSVLRVGFLPKWMDSPGGARFDAGGLASVAGQASPHPELHLEGEGTDEMRFGRRTVKQEGAKNLPTLAGQEVVLADYAPDLMAGFERLYRLLLTHRAKLFAADGPLAAFAAGGGVETRVVFRPTATYGELLNESVHPDVLGNALLRDSLLDRLWVAVVRKPYLARLVAAERADLSRGDIPLFTVRAGSTDLRTGQGMLHGFFGETGLERVRGNVNRLSEADLGLQLFTLHGCLAALDLSRRVSLADLYRLRPAAAPPAAKDLTAAARAVGDRLEAVAFRGPKDAWWLTLAALEGGRWAFATAQAELYGGVPGIVLFLAYLARQTGEERYLDLARRGVVTIGEILERGTPARHLAGAWGGMGGLLYTFAHLAVLWKDETLLDRAQAFLPELRDLVAADSGYDLLSGAAGAIAALLILHELRPEAGALEIALRAGERLAAGALVQENGVAWPPAVPGSQPLVGYSHGTAGIAWALFRLAAATGEVRFADLAHSALAYERSLYDPVRKNWVDFREFTGLLDEGHALDPSMSAWCNGAAGIGLARLDTLSLFDGPEVREEIAIAVETTLARGFGQNHCLCHGDLGNLELLFLAARKLGDPDLADKAGRIAGGILADFQSSGWRLGAPRGIEPPGLMVGLAGVGYGLLRLAAPEEVPSVLLLEGPFGDLTRSRARPTPRG